MIINRILNSMMAVIMTIIVININAVNVFLTKMDRRGFTMIMAAKDRQGSAFLQDTLTHGSQKNIDVIFSHLKTDLCSLMMHQFGNLVVQKLIDVVDHNKLDEILDLLTTDCRLFGQV